ncbi:NAD(P)/FAD-dependent oxidoreductase [Loigolactobacillus coryniformis]|uniref:NAD(P)/FAD-dependent oxidoreductase n=1 Tax=Loigolactobacillus coryniformis TaxID=1610 RepID=A0A5B8TG18_9LACO|nr:NAD(P)/FAD-dependent oxidoreductase [Loigolactobacillus coryniformis]QEA52832.1 NAD(P)/FAD-dependent oxidoreductase [Loigolactobacillus coryniformis]
MTNILILGAGYAGLRAAKVLAQQKLDATITLIDRNRYHYETTSLPEVAAGTRRAQSIILPLPENLPTQINFIQATVTKIDRGAKQVDLADGQQLTYDYLVVALGLESEDYGIPGAAEFALPIVDVKSALAVKKHLEDRFQNYQASQDPDDLRIVVCGAWFSSFEFMGALVNRLPKLAAHYQVPLDKIEIQCIEAKDMILPMFDDDLTNYVKQWLSDHNIVLRTGTPIKEVLANKVVTEEQTYTANTLVWTTGVRGSHVIGDSDFEQRRNRVMVSDELSLEDDPNVFLLGDVAAVRQPGKPYPFPATGQIAFQMADAAAANIAADLNGAPRQDFVFNDLGTVLALGSKDGVAKVFGDHKLRGYTAAVMKRVIDDRSLLKQVGVKALTKYGRFPL